MTPFFPSHTYISSISKSIKVLPLRYDQNVTTTVHLFRHWSHPCHHLLSLGSAPTSHYSCPCAQPVEQPVVTLLKPEQGHDTLLLCPEALRQWISPCQCSVTLLSVQKGNPATYTHIFKKLYYALGDIKEKCHEGNFNKIRCMSVQWPACLY